MYEETREWYKNIARTIRNADSGLSGLHGDRHNFNQHICQTQHCIISKYENDMHEVPRWCEGAVQLVAVQYASGSSTQNTLFNIPQ